MFVGGMCAQRQVFAQGTQQARTATDNGKQKVSSYSHKVATITNKKFKKLKNSRVKYKHEITHHYKTKMVQLVVQNLVMCKEYR